jgi:periplasmic protein CpxP/Spy
MKTVRTPFFAAVLLTGVAALGLSPALAQTTPAPANSAAAQTEAHHHPMPRILPGQMVDGRIAFLKAELKITPAQEAQWQQVAAAMRQNANALDQAITAARSHRGNGDAVERMTVRGEFARVRAENAARMLTAFRPLYASLSPEQQQMANMLVVPHHGWHREGHHRA